jgi:hypothetical protein
VIRTAIETDDPRLRYPVSWGGPELLSRRPQISDAEWLALGAVATDEEYVVEFERLFGVSIAI